MAIDQIYSGTPPSSMLKLIKKGKIKEGVLLRKGMLMGPCLYSQILSEIRNGNIPPGTHVFNADEGKWFISSEVSSETCVTGLSFDFQSTPLTSQEIADPRNTTPMFTPTSFANALYQCPQCGFSSHQKHESCAYCKKKLMEAIAADAALMGTIAADTARRSFKTIIRHLRSFVRGYRFIPFIQLVNDRKSKFNFAKHVDESDVREISTKHHIDHISATIEIIRPGTYLVAGGRVGIPTNGGEDTFIPGSIATETVTATKCEMINLRINTRVSRGYWAVGIFRATDDLPLTDASDKMLTISENEFVGIAAAGAVALLLVVTGMFSDNSKPSPDSPSGRPAGMSESDYNYINRKFRKEGFSAKEADEATRAVNNFHRAQQLRNGR